MGRPEDTMTGTQTHERAGKIATALMRAEAIQERGKARKEVAAVPWIRWRKRREAQARLDQAEQDAREIDMIRGLTYTVSTTKSTPPVVTDERVEGTHPQHGENRRLTFNFYPGGSRTESTFDGNPFHSELTGVQRTVTAHLPLLRRRHTLTTAIVKNYATRPNV